MSKKIISAFLALAMLAATACTQDNSSEPARENSSSASDSSLLDSDSENSSSDADDSSDSSSENTTTTSETTTTTTTTSATTTTENSTTTTTTKEQATTTTKQAVATTKATVKVTAKATTKATTKSTTKTTPKPASYIGKCQFCGKNITANDGVYQGEFYICNTCKGSKCLLCGKACNSSIGKQQSDRYIGTHWFCYACRPDLKPSTQPNITGTDADARREAQTVVQLTNKLRASKGLSQLKTDGRLTEAAMARAKELAIKFSHSRPSGKAGATIVYEYISTPNTSGENIHMSYGTGYHDGEYIYSSFENSPGHKATMLVQNTQYVGVGIYYVYKDGYKYTYAVQLFCISV